jgi:hypothetical protein
MEHDQGPQRNRDARTYALVVLIVVAVLAMVVLHLTGVVGPGSH